MAMGCGSPFQSGIVRRKQYSCLCGVLQGGIMNDEECMFCDCLNGGLNLYVLAISTFSFAILYIKTSRASLCLSSGLRQFKRCTVVSTII